ncbi:DUF397 domain-containing protein [Lentzea sp. NBC_00516]|uniref:DUF397 domain-containing protein n=1 Tax=Lentzea sp. NBC_00516 TaxID=2903582 RepID=UPI002E824BAA|nr:DUF397 domain-containing protein [Lentzea sp. NBC_00516]WUD29931.1 DUF397 domain-containing protein [Lentzea sp. NBC_00516]
MATSCTRRPLAVDRSTSRIYAQVWPCRVGDLAGRATVATELTWKRSSYTNGNDPNCVECAVDGSAVWIRDSKDRNGRRLVVAWSGWRAFVAFARS